MTGAPLPDGADAVVMQEYAELRGPEAGGMAAPPRVRFHDEPIRAGQNILRRGAALEAGDVVLRRAADSADRDRLACRSRPRHAARHSPADRGRVGDRQRIGSRRRAAGRRGDSQFQWSAALGRRRPLRRDADRLGHCPRRAGGARRAIGRGLEERRAGRLGGRFDRDARSGSRRWPIWESSKCFTRFG